MLFFKKKQDIKPEEKPTEKPSLTPEQALEAAGIDMDIAMQYLAGDMDIFVVTVQSFAEETPELRRNLQTSLEGNDMQKFSVYVHGVKSNAKSFGAMKLFDIAYDLELKSKAGEVDYVAETYPTLIAAWDNVLDAINSFLEAQ